MSLTAVTIFGTSRDGVDDFAEYGRQLCKRQGAGFDGPAKLQCLRCGQAVKYFELDMVLEGSRKGFPEWFVRIELSDTEEEAVRSAVSEANDKGHFVVFGRHIVIREDSVASDFVREEIPENVFLRVGVDVEEVPEPKGRIPHSYDPAVDYVTDMDYDAHY